MTEMQNPSNWADILKKCLNDLKCNNSKLSISQIASKIDIARSTLNDQFNSQKSPPKPSFDNYLKIILKSGNDNLLFDAISAYDSKLSESFLKSLAVSLSQENKAIATEELENILENRSVFLTYVLASNEDGVPKSLLYEIVGSSAKSSVELLKKKNLLIEEFEVYKIIESTNLIRSYESIKFHLSTYAEHYKPEHAGTGLNYILSMTAFLNEKGIHEINAQYKDHHKKLVEIIGRLENKGTIPVFAVAYFDTFTHISNQKNSSNNSQGLN